MPLLSTLVAPGSPYRVLPPHGIRASLPYCPSLTRTRRKSYPRSACFYRRNFHSATPQASTRNCRSNHNLSQRPLIASGRLISTRKYSPVGESSNSTTSPENDLPLNEESEQNREVGGEHATSEQCRTHYLRRKSKALRREHAASSDWWTRYSRRKAKAFRPSEPAMIVYSMQNTSRDLYDVTPPRRIDLSYALPKRGPYASKKAQSRQGVRHHQHLARSASLHSILSQHVCAVTTNPASRLIPALSTRELYALHSRGYTINSVEKWTQSVLEKHSVLAASLFKDQNEIPPLFLVNLFLRRKRIKTRAFGIVMRHLQSRIQFQDLPWASLQILVVRLLRHARRVWPEAISWIGSFYTTVAARIYRHKKMSDMARFSNTVLQLISQPTSVNAFANVKYQEEAQFQVLQFMASCEPALVLTQSGFRAVTRIQLAQPKTTQEKDWASLKGPGWPPWKQNRNAMDEEKGYEFGASRASRVMHKMYEAGYEGRAWEQIAEIYAGWDTDQSPTIQWRTLFSHVSTAVRHKKSIPLTWAARVRATRTRREAWACFLACEASGDDISAEVYIAMFEKLHDPMAKNPKESRDRTPDSLLPGDTKEVTPEDRSPLHHVHLDERLPSLEELYHRMLAKNISLTGRLVAFLIETLPNIFSALQLLEATQDMFDGGVRYLLEGSVPPSNVLPVPEYFFASFIKFLCRFGRKSRPPSTKPLSLPIHSTDHAASLSTDHYLRLESDVHYRDRYALSLLMHYKPAYNRAWAEYAEKIQYYHNLVEGSTKENTAVLRAACAVKQYRTLCMIFKTLDDIDQDANDSLFLRLCMTARRVTYFAYRGLLSRGDAEHVFCTARRTVRVAFLDLIGTDVDLRSHNLPQQQSKPFTHVPDLTVLHLYVRTLGMLRDYEGLYSLSIWMTDHHEQVKTLARARKGGVDQLFFMIVALRSGLEGAWRRESSGEPCLSPELVELVELVKARIESVEEWAWPSNNEVAHYVSVSRDKNYHHSE